MSSSSVEEIIGGVDNGGGIPQQGDEDRSSLSGGGGASAKDELWLQDLDLGNQIFGITALVKIGIILLIWFLYFWNGTNIRSYYWWTWFTAVLAIVLPWTPVGIAYILMVTMGGAFADRFFFYSSLVSIIGPMVFYFVPFVVLVLAYDAPATKDTGLTYKSKANFWFGWWSGIFFVGLSILFEFAFLPGIRVWYELKLNPSLLTEEDEEEEVQVPEGEIFIPPEEEEEEDGPITTFLADISISI